MPFPKSVEVFRWDCHRVRMSSMIPGSEAAGRRRAASSGDQLQIDLSHVLIRPFVFQPQVGESDLSLDDRQAVLLREFLFVLKLFGLGKLVELRELPVERALELEVENDTRNFASRASNPFGLALVEPVEGGIVPGLARLHESVIEGLPPAVVVDSLAFKEAMLQPC
jgi:hypothetical protein